MYTVMSVFCVFNLWLSFPRRAEMTLTRGMWDSAVRFCWRQPGRNWDGRKLAQSIAKSYERRIVSPGWLSVKGAWRSATPLTMSSSLMSPVYRLSVTEGFAFGRKVCQQNWSLKWSILTRCMCGPVYQSAVQHRSWSSLESWGLSFTSTASFATRSCRSFDRLFQTDIVFNRTTIPNTKVRNLTNGLV